MAATVHCLGTVPGPHAQNMLLQGCYSMLLSLHCAIQQQRAMTHMLPDLLLLLWRLPLRPQIQLLMQLCIRSPQITQPQLHLQATVCPRML